MAAAGTDFVVAKRPIYVGPSEPGYGFTAIPGYAATYRTDNNQVLGVVSADYQLVQNLTPMQMLGEIVRTKEAGIVAHAALGKGERLFAVLELSRLKDIKIPGDPSDFDAFLVAQWWHDGTGALTFGPSMVRTDCQNMANAQLLYAEGKGRLARIVHRGDTADAVEEARKILGYAERNIDVWVNLMSELADQPIPGLLRPWLDKYTEKLIPIPADMERPGSRIEARELIANVITDSDKLAGVPMTAYRVYQGVIEYADHHRPLRVADENLVPARRFTSSVDGPAAALKHQALRLLRQEFEVR